MDLFRYQNNLRYIKGRLNNYRIRSTISLFIAGETPAFPARNHIIQTFLKHSLYFLPSHRIFIILNGSFPSLFMVRGCPQIVRVVFLFCY